MLRFFLPVTFCFAPVLALSGCLGGDAEAGESTYNFQCVACHNQDGSGGIPIASSQAGLYDTGPIDTGGAGSVLSADLRLRVPQISDEYILSVLWNGKGNMPSQFGESDTEAVDVLAYLRQTFEPKQK